MTISSVIDIIPDTMDQKELVADAERRIEIALVVAIFFPSFLATLGIPLTTILSWTVLVGFSIYEYVAFELIKRAVSQNFLKWFSGFLLLEIALFIQPILLYSTALNIHLNKYVYYLDMAMFYISYYGIDIVAFALAAITSVGFGLWLGRKITKQNTTF
jgi:hypothetical protein